MSPLTAAAYDDGQVYVTDADGDGLLHAKIHGRHDVTIQTDGSGRVEIEKLYGASLASVRVSLDGVEWVVERNDEDGWRECCRIPGEAPDAS